MIITLVFGKRSKIYSYFFIDYVQPQLPPFVVPVRIARQIKYARGIPEYSVCIYNSDFKAWVIL